MQTLAIEKIEQAIQETNLLLSTGEDFLLQSLLNELNRYKMLTQDHRPLSYQEKTAVDIGRVAVRELDELHPEYVTLLCDVGALLREEAD